MIIENKCGYKLLEYISCSEEDIVNYNNVTSAGAVVNIGGNYLIGFNNWRKQWEIPAGRIEKGESARQATIRELYEETHQNIDNMQFMGLFKKMRANGEVVHMAIFYGTKSNLKKFIKKADDENDEIKLWDLKEDIGYVDEIDVKIIKMVREKI